MGAVFSAASGTGRHACWWAIALLVAVAIYWPFTARADFPPIQGSLYFTSNNGFPYTSSTGPYAACSSPQGSRCLSGEGAPNCNAAYKTFNWPCVSTPSGCVPHVSSVVNIGNPDFRCRLVRADNGQGEILLVFNHQPGGGTFCPANSTLVAGQCRCDPGYTESGSSCWISPKNRGCSPDKVGNPCNAGTGSKFHLEAVYSGGGELPLLEQLSYNSQTLAHPLPVSSGAYGKGWKGHYERQIAAVSGVARAGRPDGREFEFHPPSSGNVYVADADVSDRLERLTDGSGNTTGWKYVVAADESTELYGPTGALRTT